MSERIRMVINHTDEQWANLTCRERADYLHKSAQIRVKNSSAIINEHDDRIERLEIGLKTKVDAIYKTMLDRFCQTGSLTGKWLKESEKKINERLEKLEAKQEQKPESKCKHHPALPFNLITSVSCEYCKKPEAKECLICNAFKQHQSWTKTYCDIDCAWCISYQGHKCPITKTKECEHRFNRTRLENDKIKTFCSKCDEPYKPEPKFKVGQVWECVNGNLVVLTKRENDYFYGKRITFKAPFLGKTKIEIVEWAGENGVYREKSQYAIIECVQYDLIKLLS